MTRTNREAYADGDMHTCMYTIGSRETPLYCARLCATLALGLTLRKRTAPFHFHSMSRGGEHPGRRGLRGLALAALCLQGASAWGAAQKYLVVAAPSASRIAYLRLPETGAPATGSEPMETLIDSGLTFPQGVAVDDYRRMLYVADPALGKLVGYSLRHEGGRLSVGPQETVASGAEVRSVSVDGDYYEYHRLHG